MAIIGGIMVPHPPLIVPEVGKGEERVIEETTRAYEKAAEFVASLKPDTIVLSSPHVVMYGDYLHICPGDGAGGNPVAEESDKVAVGGGEGAEREDFVAGGIGEERLRAEGELRVRVVADAEEVEKDGGPALRVERGGEKTV